MKNLFLLLIICYTVFSCSESTPPEESKTLRNLALYANSQNPDDNDNNNNDNIDDGNGDNNNNTPPHEELNQPLETYVYLDNIDSDPEPESNARFDDTPNLLGGADNEYLALTEYDTINKYVGIARTLDRNIGTYESILLQIRIESSTGQRYLIDYKYGADVDPATPSNFIGMMYSDAFNVIPFLIKAFGNPNLAKGDEIAVVTFYHPDDVNKETPLDTFSIRI